VPSWQPSYGIGRVFDASNLHVAHIGCIRNDGFVDLDAQVRGQGDAGLLEPGAVARL
jgi:hypothetical protein